MNRMKKKHIDDVQTSTVNEHFKLILEDDSINKSACNITSDDLPHWYNKYLYKKAQNFYKQNIMAINVAHVVGVIAVFSITSILKVLMYTKQSSTTCAAFKRYLQTFLHIQQLYTCDANNSDSNWYKSINIICWKHKTSNENSRNAGIGPIYQRDMALTQFAFVGYVLIASKFFGMRNKPEEEEAFNHFWRVNGYMLGIPDRLNVCRKTAMETHELCQKIKENVFMNALDKNLSDFHHVTSNVLNSFWYVDLQTNKDSALALIYRIHGIKYKPLQWCSWLHSKYTELIFKLCLIPYIGKVIKMYLNFMFIFKVLVLAKYPVFAWAKFGKNNVKLNLYPKYE